jgi:hypothetical protein
MPRLTVRPEAKLDALETASWYEGERANLGTERNSSTNISPSRTFGGIRACGRDASDGRRRAFSARSRGTAHTPILRSAPGGLAAVSGVVPHETWPLPGRRISEEFLFPIWPPRSGRESPARPSRTASGAVQKRLATLRLATRTLDDASGVTPHAWTCLSLTGVRKP